MLAGQWGLKLAAEHVEVGEHLCMVYDHRDDQLATVDAFVRSGLERGERCLYIVDDNTAEAVLSSMRRARIDIDVAVSTGTFVIADRRDAYLRDGRFDPDAMFQFLNDAVAAAKAAGFSALRLFGEMTWVLGNEPGDEQLLAYEAELNRFLQHHDLVALCHYNRRRFDPAIIRGVLETHPLVIYGSLVCSNPYYIPPEERLHPDENAAITRLLQILVDRERALEQLRAAREQLQILTRRLVEAQEAERRAVARELHDELGQLLTGLMFLLERAELSVPEQTGEWLREAKSLVDDLTTRVRELALRLRPTILDEFGLLPALRWHIERYQRQTGLHASLQVERIEDRRFPTEVESAAYRIVQEALTNVARHAKTSEVTVRLWADEKALHVEVEDQGVGFDPDALRGAGLTGMRERVLALGGSMTIETLPGTGVRIAATLPFYTPG